MEMDEDENFKELLQILRSRQGNVLSLEALALSCISHSTEFFLGKQDPFDCLPVPLFGLVADELQQNNLPLYNPLYRLLLCEKLRSLKINHWSAKGPVVVCPLLQKLHASCQSTLTHLHLERSFWVGPYQRWTSVREQGRVSQLLAPFRSLTHLTLQNTFGVTDETLAVVGTNCPDLRCLNLECNKFVSNRGIKFLCAAPAPLGQCTKLEVLNLQRCCRVNKMGLVSALHNLPHLTNLGAKTNLLPALMKFIKMNGKKKKLLKLTNFYASSNVQFNQLIKISEIVPCVTTIHLTHHGTLRNIDVLLNFDRVSELCLPSIEMRVPTFNLFITKLSSSLTTFESEFSMYDLDLSIFAQCVSLIKLKLVYGQATANSFELLPSSFLKLRHLNLQLCEPGQVLGDWQSGQLLSSPDLAYCRLELVLLPQQVLHSLIDQACRHQQIFSSLKHFETVGTGYCLDTLKQLICVSPSLTILKCPLSPLDQKRLRSFVERNKLQVRI